MGLAVQLTELWAFGVYTVLQCSSKVQLLPGKSRHKDSLIFGYVYQTPSQIHLIEDEKKSFCN